MKTEPWFWLGSGITRGPADLGGGFHVVLHVFGAMTIGGRWIPNELPGSSHDRRTKGVSDDIEKGFLFLEALWRHGVFFLLTPQKGTRPGDGHTWSVRPWMNIATKIAPCHAWCRRIARSRRSSGPWPFRRDWTWMRHRVTWMRQRQPSRLGGTCTPQRIHRLLGLWSLHWQTVSPIPHQRCETSHLLRSPPGDSKPERPNEAVTFRRCGGLDTDLLGRVGRSISDLYHRLGRRQGAGRGRGGAPAKGGGPLAEAGSGSRATSSVLALRFKKTRCFFGMS